MEELVVEGLEQSLTTFIHNHKKNCEIKGEILKGFVIYLNKEFQDLNQSDKM